MKRYRNSGVRMAKIHESFASYNNLGIYQGIIYGKI